ncbi:uncharacterized protein LOC121979598 [Zingiber officinale]|uniref:uncharacterized protein LOC121979598 n=1 Tax=Zingiber officinale TaxID=94328 RepID=UPI001C4C4053|nr:uncharacterized protein LOC121979598 [Zingiber officinale]
MGGSSPVGSSKNGVKAMTSNNPSPRWPTPKATGKPKSPIGKSILKVLRARLDHMGGNWVDKLPSMLWALCTTLKEATGVTPFQLVYGGEVVVPMEVGVESDQVQHYNEGNAEWRLMELDLVDETRAKSVIRIMAYQHCINQNYYRGVISRSFQVGDII